MSSSFGSRTARSWILSCLLFAFGCDAGSPLLANGEACSEADACGSGFCVDGLCCDAICDGACSACAASLTGGTDGTCAPVPDGTVCRPSQGGCDLVEVCSAGSCASDEVEAAGTECRASAGACDPAESCDGSSAACPSDARTQAGTECRASEGPCDPSEACDGSSAACPSDARTQAGTECRASAGPCDLTESCDGTSVACPADEKRATGTECRASGGTCDVAELCDGVSDACASDAYLAVGTASSCAPYLCSGTMPSCPTSCTASAQCASGHACSGGTCRAAKRVFVTSTTYTGSLGGVAGADALCQARAVVAGFSGTYRAWLSVGSNSPSMRFTRHTGPYVRTDGVVVADDFADLIDGTLDAPIARTELGTAAPTVFVWTNTGWNGAYTAFSVYDCMGYTSASNAWAGTAGRTDFADSTWTNASNENCNGTWSLYCFEQ